jgi:hypothetical protein
MSNPIHINKTEINVSVFPPVDVAAYATGDVLFVPVQVNVLDYVHPTKKLRVRVANVTVIDQDSQNGPFDLHFFNGPTAPLTYGALNGAQALSAAEAFASLRGVVPVTAYTVVNVNVGVAHPAMPNIPWVITLPPGQRYMFVAATARGAPNYFSSGSLKIILGLEIINDVHA